MKPVWKSLAFALLLGTAGWLGSGCATKTAPMTETPTAQEEQAATTDSGASETPAEAAEEAPEEPIAATGASQSPPKAETDEQPPVADPPIEKPKPAVRASKPPTPADISLSTPPETPVEQPKQAGEADDEVVVIETTKGRFVVELYPGDAPKHVENFKKLARDHFYEGRGNRFHRYVAQFVIQGGDPNRDGTGGPGYTIPAEIKRKHLKGTVAMARLGDEANPQRESSGSQFYVCLADLPNLDGGYSAFGQVIQGMDVVLKLRANDEMRKLSLRPRSEFVK